MFSTTPYQQPRGHTFGLVASEIKTDAKRPPADPVHDALVDKHFQHTPEGKPAVHHEGKISLEVGAILAIGGLVVAAAVLYFYAGLGAAAMGAVFLLMYYGVAWAVVWGPGLIRAREETEAEEIVEIKRHGDHPPPPPIP